MSRFDVAQLEQFQAEATYGVTIQTLYHWRFLRWSYAIGGPIDWRLDHMATSQESAQDFLDRAEIAGHVFSWDDGG